MREQISLCPESVIIFSLLVWSLTNGIVLYCLNLHLFNDKWGFSCFIEHLHFPKICPYPHDVYSKCKRERRRRRRKEKGRDYFFTCAFIRTYSMCDTTYNRRGQMKAGKTHCSELRINLYVCVSLSLSLTYTHKH